jgi:hypothetical protein
VLPCGMGLAWDLKIDGQQILYQSASEPSAELMVEQVNEDLWAVKFYFTRLYEAMQTYGVETGPDVTHTIYMNATNFYVCNEVVWVYDSAEAPGGAIFNLLDPKQLRFYTKVDVFNPPPPIEG